MLKFLLKILLIALPSIYLLEEYPWWTVMVIAFIICAIIKTNWFLSFLSSFLAIGGLWFYKAYQIDAETNSILTNKIAELFALSNPFLLVIITAVVGGLAAGFGGLSGHTFIKLFEKKKSLYY